MRLASLGLVIAVACAQAGSSPPAPDSGVDDGSTPDVPEGGDPDATSPPDATPPPDADPPDAEPPDAEPPCKVEDLPLLTNGNFDLGAATGWNQTSSGGFALIE